MKNDDRNWCMCTVIGGVARDMYVTCYICGGMDAYGLSTERPEKYKKITRTEPKAITKEWISINDELPKKGKCIDVWSASYGRFPNYSMDGTPKKNRYFSAVYSGLTCVRDVTHWMPLPEAPNE